MGPTKLFCFPKMTAPYLSIISNSNKQQAVGRNATLQFTLFCFVLFYLKSLFDIFIPSESS